MSAPPNTETTQEMWDLWENCTIPGVKLSGIYANKKGYHNTVEANIKHWPQNYSIELPIDRDFNPKVARAIDLTMSDEEMVRWTTRMKNAAENPADTRLGAVREFYGTLDNKTVFGLIKDSVSGSWRRSTADSTHLWHGHTSIFSIFVRNWPRLSPLLSVWRGESFAEWSLGNMLLPKQGDSGESVAYWQHLHNTVRNYVKPPAPQINVDSKYGPATAAAFADYYHKLSMTSPYDGSKMTGWLGVQYHKALTFIFAPKVPPAAPTEEQIKAAVADYLSKNLPKNLVITGDVNGRITIP